MRLLVLLAACGTAPSIDHDGGLPYDAPSACVERAPAVAAHLHAGVFRTFAGTGCVVGGCHFSGMTGIGATAFQFAGTVYGDDGMTPNIGATVQINPDLGAGASAVTDSAGNFFIRDGTLPDPFPGRVQATVCPSIAVMPETLTAGTNNCNTFGCHNAAGNMPVHLEPTM
jgi:hypothetical protein